MDQCPKCGQIHQRDGVATCYGHRKGDGHFCTKYPPKGSKVCLSHGGGARQVRAKAKERTEMEAVREQANRLGVPKDVDPGPALIGLVREAAGNVEFYRTLVAEVQIHPDKDELTVDDEGSHWKRGAAGIYGRTYHQSGIPTGEAKPNILVTLYNDERDRLAGYCQAALRAGVDERRLQLQEQEARELMEGVVKAITAAKLTPQQAEVFRREFADHLRRAESPALTG